MAKMADSLVTLVSLASFALYFIFPHVILAKEISENKDLEFDMSKAFKAIQISDVSQAGAGFFASAGKGEAVNYTPYAVMAETVNAGTASEADRENGNAAYIPARKEYKVIGTKQVYVTAYSSTPDQTDSTPFITASNTHVRDGVAAANWLPFGTKIKIPAVYPDKIFIVEDRMNARYGRRADIWFPTRQEALNFGIKWLNIEILAEN